MSKFLMDEARATPSSGQPSLDAVGAAPSPTAPKEIAISRWWRFANLPEPLTTVDAQPLQVVFRGGWSHGLGPDFRGAMIARPSGELLTGSIEIHRSSSDWYAHGHQRDPAYNDVILHAVLRHDGPPTRRADGKLVPIVQLAIPEQELAQFDIGSARWAQVGGNVCAESIAAEQPELIRQAIWQLGDRRLSAKVARLEASLTLLEPANLLWREILDGLGYTANRQPMSHLAALAPPGTLLAIASTVAASDQELLLIGLLLGAGGFLPLSPAYSGIAALSPEFTTRIEDFWVTQGGPWQMNHLSPASWSLARVRPANHPVRRLATAGLLLARAASGLVFEVVETIRNGGDLVQRLVDLSTWSNVNLLGHDRAQEIVANTCIPFSMAFANHNGDIHLGEQVSRYWESLHAVGSNQITRRAERQVAGETRITGLRARGMQGLIHLDTTLCAPRRCFECPVALLVMNALPGQDSETQV